MISQYLLNKYRRAVANAKKNPGKPSKMFGSLAEGIEELAELESRYAAQQARKWKGAS